MGEMSRPTQVSMQDVAKAAGVSPQTVSRVANGSDAVKPETRQRVEAAMEHLGYRPNYAARALKHGQLPGYRRGDVQHRSRIGNARILDCYCGQRGRIATIMPVTIQTMRPRSRNARFHAAIDRMQQSAGGWCHRSAWRNASPISSEYKPAARICQSCSSARIRRRTTAPPLTPTSMAARPLSSIT